MGEYAEEPDYKIWHTRENKRMLVKDMSAQHLYNTIAMLRRSTKAHRAGYIMEMEAELKRR